MNERCLEMFKIEKKRKMKKKMAVKLHFLYEEKNSPSCLFFFIDNLKS